MKIPKHILSSMSNESYIFQESNFEKISFHSFHLNIPFTNLLTNDSGSLLITKTKNEIFIYIEYIHKMDKNLKNALDKMENHILSQPFFSKKIRQQKLNIRIYEQTVNFKKLQKKRKIQKMINYIGSFSLLTISFFLITFFSLRMNHHISSFHFYLTSVLALLSFYFLYRSSISYSKDSHRNSFRFFIISSVATCISLFSYLLIG